jgi:hypothetical protein
MFVALDVGKNGKETELSKINTHRQLQQLIV